MKKIAILGALALGVGVMVVAVWMASSGGGAEATSDFTVCHYDGGKVTQNHVHEQDSWSIVEVGNANALAKHIAKHQDPFGVFDEVIGQVTCDTRDGTVGNLVAPGPPGQQP